MMTTTRLRVDKPVYRTYFVRTFAFTLLFAFFTELAYSARTFVWLNEKHTMSASGTGPVPDMADGMVDLYTGDFRYSLPLLSVPGPNGENVDLSANYAGGIRMNQGASWIGLGWDLSPGEISRQVVGVPDDFAGQYVLNAELIPQNGDFSYVESPGYKAVHYFGPLNYDKLKVSDNHNLPPQAPLSLLNQTFKPDQISIRKQIRDDQDNSLNDYTNLFNHVNSATSNSGPAPILYMNFNSAPFIMSAYDNYYVSGPGIAGKLKPYLLSGRTAGARGNDNVYLTESAENLQHYQNNSPNYKRMQFHFENSNKLNFTNGTIYSSTNDNYMPSSTFVRYFKNSEINTSSNIISSTVPGSPGFLDFQAIPNGQSRRDASFHDPDAIGGIQVTDASGLTYHYSLPVFSEKQLNKQIYATQATADYLSPTNAFQKMTMNYQHDHYASSWKLTAVTGRDYIDKNGNKMADEGDEGYWVQYKYSLWQSDFLEGSNYYNYGKTFSPKYTEAKTIVHKSFVKTYYISNWETQKFYLDFIRTASHTAYFIKDTRLDNHSFESSLKANEKVSPELKLTRIVLLKNTDKNLIENSVAWGTNSIHNRFISSLFSTPQSPSLIHVYKYLFNKSAIDAKSLASVEFETDYSLCKGYHRNVNNTFASTLVSSQVYCTNNNASLFYQQLNYNMPGLFNYLDPANTGFTTTSLSNSGKLTLKAIHSFGEGGVGLFDPVKFDYDQNNAVKNPNYNPDKVDFWGYYKSDASNIINTSNYATPTSGQNVDAWSLKTITTALGANIQIEYEPDVFEREGFVDRYTGGINVSLLTRGVNKYKPHLFLPIINASGSYQSIWFTSQYLSPDYANDEQSYINASGYGLCNVSVGSYNNSSTPPYNINRFTVLPIATMCQQGANQPNYNIKVNFLGYGSTGNGNFDKYFNANYGANNLPLMENGFKTFLLDIFNSGCTNMYSGAIPYDYTLGMGFTYIVLNKMVGGGTRVKSIQIKENESGSITKKEYSYTDGYCKVVPRPFMYAPVVGGNFYEVWDNNDMFLPYFNASGVGYSKVETKNTAVGFSNLNIGRSVYTFNNDPIRNPVVCALRGFANWVKFTCSCLTPQAHTPQSNTPTHNNCAQPVHRKYVFDCTYNDEQDRKQGLLISLQHYNADNKEVYKQTMEYSKHSILEKYYVPNRSWDIPALTCFGWHGTPNSCTHTEELEYLISSTSNYYYPVKVTETMDGLTTTREMEYEPVSGFIKKTKVSAPGTPLTEEEIQYAFEVPAYYSLGSKSQNINNYNMMGVPYSKKTRKDGLLIRESRTENLKSRNTRIRLEPGTGANSLTYYYSYLNDQSAANTNPDIPVFLENWEKPILNNAPLANQTVTSPDIRSGLTTLFDKRGHILETEGSNGRKSASKYGYNTSLLLSTINNAGYNSFAFSSFEDLYPINQSITHFGGEVSGGHTRSGSFNIPNSMSIIKPHSGNYMSLVPAGQNGPEVTLTQFDLNRTYEAKVWIHSTSSSAAALKISLSGINTSNVPVNISATVTKSDPANITIGNWTLMRVKLSLPNDLYMPVNPKTGTMALNNEPQLKISLLNGSNAYACFDDLMVHPVDAAISGVIYDEHTYRIKASINSEGFGTYFFYDAAGRLTATFGESAQYGLKKLSENEYNNCKSFLMALPNAGNSNGGTQ